MRKVMLMTVLAAGLAMTAAPAGAQPYGSGMMGGYGGGYGMMGGGGMGPGMMFGYANHPVYPGWGGGVLDYAQAAAYIRQGDQSGNVDAKANTITYSGKDIMIDMVAVQPDHKDQTFEVHGLTNPTLVVSEGAIVHLNLVNMDYGNNMQHGLVLTPAPPPYPVMSMMATGRGLAQVMPLLPWRSHKDVKDARYASLGATFDARQRGTYWYVCPTPDHAQQGMFGKFVVQ